MSSRFVLLASSSLLLLGCGDPELECEPGVLIESEEAAFCAFAEGVDVTCPEGLGTRVYVANGYPTWAEICTDAAPDADGEVPLPADVCREVRALGATCVGVTAVDGGQCCDYTGSCISGGHGGWAPRADSCLPTWANDGAYSEEVDARGCPYLAPRGLCSGGEMCCIE